MAGTIVPRLEVMESVQFSKDDTLIQLLNLLRIDSHKFNLIEELSDVDIVDDLKNLRYHLENMIGSKEVILVSQKSILEWLNIKNLA